MGNKGGRPPKGQRAETQQVRLDPELAEWISWIVKIKKCSTAVYLGPILRDTVRADYEANRAEIEITKRLEAQAAEALAAAQEKAAGRAVLPAVKRKAK